MHFHVGQRVTRVNASSWPRYRGRVALPVLGRTYTVRAIVPTRQEGWDEDGIRLVEIVNRPTSLLTARGTLRRTEVVFRQSRFRPLRTTSIEAFTKLLEPVPVRQKEPAEV